MSLSRALIEILNRSAAQSLPSEVATAARLHLLDAIGVGLAAAGSSVGAPYRRYASAQSGAGRASVFAQADGAAPAQAALINGGLIHSLEYDDTHTASIVHGSAVLAPAALAAAEAAGASGAVLLGAYARGWEVLIRIGQASAGGFQRNGFQVTSVGGTLVAAQIAAEIHGLNDAQRVAAIGIALSQGAGVFEFLSNGSTVKSMHPGWAAHGGIIAADLAAAGLEGPETTFEGRFGLFRTFVRDEDAIARFADEIASIGATWHLADAAFKFHPCCHYLHPFIEAAAELAARGVTPDAVAHIECRVPGSAATIICEPWEAKMAPPSGHAARWSLPVAVAAQLVEGRVDLDTFEQRAAPAVLDLATRMTWQPMANARFPERFEAELVCQLKDGQVHEVRIEDVFGNRSRPAGADAVRKKFRANAARALTDAAIDDLEAAVEEIEAAKDLAVLSRAMRSGRRSKGDER